MKNNTASAAGAAMPAEGQKTRRGALRFLARSTAQASALAILPVAALAAPHGEDAELLAMEAEIMRLRGLAKAIDDEKVQPFEAEFIALLKVNVEAGWAFARSYGRDDAIDEAEEQFAVPADRLCERLMATPARTQAGRAAKVRVLLADILGDEWRGPASELDWHRAQTRTLLGEFAGMSAEDLDNV